MFRAVLLSIIRTHSNGMCHTGLLTVCEQDQDGSILILLASCQQTCMTYTISVCSDDGQRNCPKHVEFYSKNKFEKLVHLVGFIIRIYHDARSPERMLNLFSPFVCSEVVTRADAFVRLYRARLPKCHCSCY